MNEPRDLEQLRADVEDRQRNITWEDSRRGGTSVDAFLWKGDPEAKPVQRAGLALFAICFLIITMVFASIAFEKGWILYFLPALFFLLISVRLFRNALMRPPKSPRHQPQKQANESDSTG